MVYLDEVFLSSKGVEEHIRDVDEILNFMERAVFKLNLAKCTFFSKELTYLGHIMKPGQLIMEPMMVTALIKA